MAMDIEPEEITKLIDGVYKNIIEKFNPCARQLIAAGKSYLKSLQGTTAASNIFNEALSKIALNAQQGTSSDIGNALISIVNINRVIQEQHMNILKAFYVDLLMPLENNLEKDTKIVQSEQKKFLQQHKINLDNYCKAIATLKKQRKKKNATGTTNKELKCLQNVEEEKKKLKKFCNNSFKSALTQERRRYGFVLERQCSISKHWETYHEAGKTLIKTNLDDWLNVAGSRETFNLNIEEYFTKKMEGSKDPESMNLRKTRSMDVASADLKENEKGGFNQNSLPRTKSEHNLTISNHNIEKADEMFDQLNIAKAIFTYESAGKNQLSFDEDDRIALIGSRANGWQFGENLRTKMLGWFPETYIAYINTGNIDHHQYNKHNSNSTTLTRSHQVQEEVSPSRMFGDTMLFRSTKYFQKISASDLRTSPPPVLPPPVPNISIESTNSSQGFNLPKDKYLLEKRKPIINKSSKYMDVNESHARNNSSKHVPPPQPEIDYSDEEVNARIPLRRDTYDMTYKGKSSSLESINSNNNNTSAMDTLNRKNNNFIKRTKSFWKNKKTEENLTTNGKLWQHKDIIVKKERNFKTEITNNKQHLEIYQNKDEIIINNKEFQIGKKHNNNNNNNNINNNNNNATINSNGKKRNINYYESQTINSNNNYEKAPYLNSDNDDDDDESDTTLKVLDRNSFDDDDICSKKGIRKTVKRKEILKQYYSSDSETERDTSDQYDCIVIDDHLVRNKLEFKTFSSNNISPNNNNNVSTLNRDNNNISSTSSTTMGTLLPRTKLNKSIKLNKENQLSRESPSNESTSNDNNTQMLKLDLDGSFSKAYGPWYDLWEQENSNVTNLNSQ